MWRMRESTRIILSSVLCGSTAVVQIVQVSKELDSSSHHPASGSALLTATWRSLSVKKH